MINMLFVVEILLVTAGAAGLIAVGSELYRQVRAYNHDAQMRKERLSNQLDLLGQR